MSRLSTSRSARRYAAAMLVLIALSALAGIWAVPDHESAEGVSHDVGGQPFIIWKTPRNTPVVSFQNARGESLTLAHFRGRTVLVNVWATWCPPCRTEMPALDRLNARVGGRAFEVVAVSIDRDPVAARAFLESVGIRTLHSYHDASGGIGSALGSFAVPLTVLVDPEGRELGRALGPAHWDGPRFESLLKSLMQGVSQP